MATSSQDDATYVNKRKLCFMCIFPSKKNKITLFSVKTWARFLEYVDKWKNLEGRQAIIAKNYAPLLTSVAGQRPTNGGFHRICYSRFTDSQRISRALKLVENKPVAVASNEAFKVKSSSGNPLKVKRQKRDDMLLSASPVKEKICDTTHIQTQDKLSFSNERRRKSNRIKKVQVQDKKKVQVQDKKKVQVQDKKKVQVQDKKKVQVQDKKKVQVQDKKKVQVQDKKKVQVQDKKKVQVQDKKKVIEEDDGKVQAAAKPVKEVEIKNPCMLQSSKNVISPKAFPIYSKGSVCGYLYMNNNQVPPTKVTLTNIGAPMTQTLPNTHPFKSAIHKPMVTPSKEKEFLTNFNTLLLNKAPINHRKPVVVSGRTPTILPKVVNTLPLSGVAKTMDNPKPSTCDMSIQLQMPKVPYLVPVTVQTNDPKQSTKKLIYIPASNVNKPNKTNNLRPFVSQGVCNKTDNSGQSTPLQSDIIPPVPSLKSQELMSKCNLKTMDQNRTNLGHTPNNPNKNNNLLPLVQHGAYSKTDNSVQSTPAHSSESQDSKLKCKLKITDKICIKQEPTGMETEYENKGRQSKFEEEENIHFSSDFVFDAKQLNDEYEREQKICQIEPDEEEEGCGLVISSTFSLSDFSELRDAFEKEKV